MDFVKEFISIYGTTILYSILTALAGYLGVAAKNIYAKYINDKTKKDVAMTCVRAVEQLYKDLHGEEKYEKALESMSEMLAIKGISISEVEMKLLIEAAVNEFNEAFEKTEVIEYVIDEDVKVEIETESEEVKE